MSPVRLLLPSLPGVRHQDDIGNAEEPFSFQLPVLQDVHVYAVIGVPHMTKL